MSRTVFTMLSLVSENVSSDVRSVSSEIFSPPLPIWDIGFFCPSEKLPSHVIIENPSWVSLCRIGKSHPRGRNFNLGKPHPWLKFLPLGWEFLILHGLSWWILIVLWLAIPRELPWHLCRIGSSPGLESRWGHDDAVCMNGGQFSPGCGCFTGYFPETIRLSSPQNCPLNSQYDCFWTKGR